VARGILYQMYEKFGTVTRADIAPAIKGIQETDKPHLARLGVRTGMETFFMPDMLKPAPIKLRVLLYSLFTKTFPDCGPPPEGRVSFDAVDGVDDSYWIVAGYRRLGQRVMRVDMVERVAALVRTAARAGQFKITDEMLSLAGVSRDQMALMLSDLGCRQTGEEPSDDPEKPAVALFERVRQNDQHINRGRPMKQHGRHAKIKNTTPKRASWAVGSRQQKASVMALHVALKNSLILTHLSQF
jgi:ATP-dependent RNA helicase SUPV3L1/SUV3